MQAYYNQYSKVMLNIISDPHVLFALVMIPGEGEFKIVVHFQYLY